MRFALCELPFTLAASSPGSFRTLLKREAQSSSEAILKPETIYLWFFVSRQSNSTSSSLESP
jgi:hypothetical protein